MRPVQCTAGHAANARGMIALVAGPVLEAPWRMTAMRERESKWHAMVFFLAAVSQVTVILDDTNAARRFSVATWGDERSPHTHRDQVG